MKQALREAGVPTAASAAANSADEVRAFAEQTGYPVILKPRSGAGALDTMRADDAAGLDDALGVFGGQGAESIAVEEFIEGHEGFYDTITINGAGRGRLRVALLPERARRDAGAVDLAAVRLDQPDRYRAGVRRAARDGAARAITALGIETSATHMEWFFGPKGLKFSEIGCRPPGVGAWDLYSAGNDMDVYRAWARRDHPRRDRLIAFAPLRQWHRGTAPRSGRRPSPGTRAWTSCGNSSTNG